MRGRRSLEEDAMIAWRRLVQVTSVLAAGLLPAGATDLKEMEVRGTLRVLAVPANRTGDEFFSRDDGPNPGFDREVLGGFCQLRKLKMEVIPLDSWDQLIPALLAGRGDLIAGRVTVTESRKKTIAFTHEVFPTRHIVFTRKPHRVVSNIEELRQEKVGTVKGTSMAEVVASAKLPDVDDDVPTGTLPKALKEGRISAAVLGVENAMAAQRRDPDIQLGMFLGPPGSLAYGVRKEDAALLQALDEYVDNLRRTPTWNRLVVKYLGDSAPEILRKARSDE
jgi:membrane-bound lytic murein transglycosylase F